MKKLVSITIHQGETLPDLILRLCKIVNEFGSDKEIELLEGRKNISFYVVERDELER